MLEVSLPQQKYRVFLKKKNKLNVIIREQYNIGLANLELQELGFIKGEDTILSTDVEEYQ
jgi:hypothetical protein